MNCIAVQFDFLRGFAGKAGWLGRGGRARANAGKGSSLGELAGRFTGPMHWPETLGRYFGGNLLVENQ